MTGLDPRDAVTQARKRPRACMNSGHAPPPGSNVRKAF
jgi:hypothetical protein